jgi:putative transposase
MSDATIHRGRVIRLYPTPAQAERLSSWVGAVRLVYNLALEQRRMFYRPGRQFNYVSQGRELSGLRQAFDWIADVPRDSLDQALIDLDQAHRNWWAGRAKSPDFRRLGQNDSIRFPKPESVRLRRCGRKSVRLRLPKIGEIAARSDQLPDGDIRSVTVRRQADQWFASIQFERAAATAQRLPGEVGIDRGIRAFAALSSGELIVGPNVGRRAANALARAQRKLARKKRGSINRAKQRRRVAKLTRARAGQGRAAKAGLNRSILDQGWSLFHRYLAYKLAERGGLLVMVPANDTSRTCAECGVVDKESRKADRFTCTSCGHSADADVNAAINILSRGRATALPVEASVSRPADEAGTSGRAA